MKLRFSFEVAESSFKETSIGKLKMLLNLTCKQSARFQTKLPSKENFDRTWSSVLALGVCVCACVCVCVCVCAISTQENL